MHSGPDLEQTTTGHMTNDCWGILNLPRAALPNKAGHATNLMCHLHNPVIAPIKSYQGLPAGARVIVIRDGIAL